MFSVVTFVHLKEGKKVTKFVDIVYVWKRERLCVCVCVCACAHMYAHVWQLGLEFCCDNGCK